MAVAQLRLAEPLARGDMKNDTRRRIGMCLVDLGKLDASVAALRLYIEGRGEAAPPDEQVDAALAAALAAIETRDAPPPSDVDSD